ncbi:MAG: hypothetical protein JRJ09_14720 [Deltaproteobacteria bacterium]|nr:hypothetical protein [Deltaproteobacteria bacterium]MBW2049762.1 hypothetical protein [Deltaproteobacteria bacterium]MBW2112670.1 hypothetical protein [Deltaproteobacteria bacterium]MBW2354507.1 hypothetical protein [Deltaproteobacteria bacterium]
MRCREETEQDREVRAPERAEAAVEAREVEAGAVEEVLPRDRAGTAFALTVVKGRPISRVPPVMTRNAPSVAPP